MVRDIRNIGLIAGIEFEPGHHLGKPGAFAFAVYLKCYELGLHVRYTGDIIAISPPLTIEKHEIDRIFNTLSDAIKYEALQGEAGLNANNYLKNEQAWAAQSALEYAALADLGHHIHSEKQHSKLQHLERKLEHTA